MLQQVLVLLHELLRAQPVVLVEEVDSQQVVASVVVGPLLVVDKSRRYCGQVEVCQTV